MSMQVSPVESLRESYPYQPCRCAGRHFIRQQRLGARWYCSQCLGWDGERVIPAGVETLTLEASHAY